MLSSNNKYTRGFKETGPFVLAPFSDLYLRDFIIAYSTLYKVNTDRNRTVSRRSELRSRTALIDEQSNP